MGRASASSGDDRQVGAGEFRRGSLFEPESRFRPARVRDVETGGGQHPVSRPEEGNVQIEKRGGGGRTPGAPPRPRVSPNRRRPEGPAPSLLSPAPTQETRGRGKSGRRDGADARGRARGRTLTLLLPLPLALLWPRHHASLRLCLFSSPSLPRPWQSSWNRC